MANPLKIAPPPPRRPVTIETVPEPTSTPTVAESMPALATPARKKTTADVRPAEKFRQVREDERVQFNKRVTRRVSDGFEMLAIRTRVKVPELLAEALELLEERYGRV